MSDLLPVGSVVVADKEEDIELMIVGYFPVDISTNTCYQYLAASFPSGVEADTPYNMFNHSDIVKVIFEGYSTEQSKKDLAQLAEDTEKELIDMNVENFG